MAFLCFIAFFSVSFSLCVSFQTSFSFSSFPFPPLLSPPIPFPFPLPFPFIIIIVIIITFWFNGNLFNPEWYMKWIAFSFSRVSSQPRDRTQVSCIAGRFFTSWATGEAQEYWSASPVDLPNSGIEPGSPALQALLLHYSFVIRAFLRGIR